MTELVDTAQKANSQARLHGNSVHGPAVYKYQKHQGPFTPNKEGCSLYKYHMYLRD